MADPVLRLTHLRKSFGDLVAVGDLWQWVAGGHEPPGWAAPFAGPGTTITGAPGLGDATPIDRQNTTDVIRLITGAFRVPRSGFPVPGSTCPLAFQGTSAAVSNVNTN